LSHLLAAAPRVSEAARMLIALVFLAALAAALFGSLFLHGLAIDRAPYSQHRLWRAIHAASLGGVALGTLANCLLLFDSTAQYLLVVPLVLVVWRITYFPLMVFSGHVVSVSEWIHAFVGLPIWIYGVFLVVIGGLHTGVSLVAGQLLAPLHPAVYLALPVVFALAIAVSFAKPADLGLLPDRFASLGDPVPPPVAPRRNPYFSRLVGPGYVPHQRIVLLAAGLTYETIPPSPWGRTVKAVLEGLFNEKPRAATADRVRDHYLAYAAAHPFIGYRDFSECPTPLPLAPDPAEG
jgi:hypothetical protein